MVVFFFVDVDLAVVDLAEEDLAVVVLTGVFLAAVALALVDFEVVLLALVDLVVVVAKEGATASVAARRRARLALNKRTVLPPEKRMSPLVCG